MKNVKAILAAALVAAGLGSSAKAVTISQIVGNYSGPLTIKYSNYDVGTLYDVAPGTYTNPDAIPLQSPPPSLKALTGGASSPFVDGDSWGIFKVKEIDGAGDTILWQTGATTSFEITGIFWGETDIQVAFDGTNENIHGVGMSIAFFADTAKNFISTDTNKANDIASAIDGQLIWTANSVPGVLAGDGVTQFDSTFKPTSSTTIANVVGAAWAKTGATAIGTGDLNSMFAPLDPNHDLEIQFTGLTKSSIWLVDSQDPVNAAAVPTPTAVWGGAMLAGMVGLKVIRRRRAE
jgi:hypothetical protein